MSASPQSHSRDHATTSGLLATSFLGTTFRNPVVLASGTCGYGPEMAEMLDLSKIGGIVTKSITRKPREGNPPVRIIGTSMGMLNAIGLANVGLERFLDEKFAESAALPTNVIASIAGDSVEDYVTVARAFDERAELPIVELNVSCPNTEDGLVFGEHPESLRSLLREIRPALAQTKLIVKLSPNAPSIVELAQAAVESGADALSLINTFKALAIDVDTRRPVIERGFGGLSGPGIHPIAVRMVQEVYEQVAKPAGDIPLIAYGGTSTWRDAAEFILAGATLVGMGTALYADPRSPLNIVRGLEKWVRTQRDAHSIENLVGKIDWNT